MISGFHDNFRKDEDSSRWHSGGAKEYDTPILFGDLSREHRTLPVSLRLLPAFGPVTQFPTGEVMRPLMLSLLMAFACSFSDPLVSLAAEDNVPPEGFIALFNGKNMNGWEGLVGDPVSRAKMSEKKLEREIARETGRQLKHWTVQDGMIVYDGMGTSLTTDRDFANFELLIDWKIEKDGDSGIYLRGSPQVQIWDPSLEIAAGVGSGGLYNNQKNPSKPLKNADKPVGEWNTFRIKMIGDKVTVHLNGELVVDNVTMENYWERDKPIYPEGRIELQHHSHPIWFKNIFIREIKEGGS